MVKVNLVIDEKLRNYISSLFKITEGLDVDFFIRKFKVRRKLRKVSDIPLFLRRNYDNYKLESLDKVEVPEYEVSFLGVATLDKMPNILEAERIIEFDSKDSIRKFLSKNTLVLQLYNNYVDLTIFDNYKYVKLFLELINESYIKAGSFSIDEETMYVLFQQIIAIYREDIKNMENSRK